MKRLFHTQLSPSPQTIAKPLLDLAGREDAALAVESWRLISSIVEGGVTRPNDVFPVVTTLLDTVGCGV